MSHFEVGDRIGAGHTFIENDQGQVLGCGGIAPLRGGNGSVCELQKMYFRASLRGTGMGTRLLKLLLDDARQLGFQQCYLETLDRMVEARNLINGRTLFFVETLEEQTQETEAP